MTNREKEVLNLIRSNPLIGQRELADKLAISRSAVAGHIMNLSTKGYIVGKGYILNEEPYVVVIGGSNMDILGTPFNNYVQRDSNPGQVSMSPGGVGRNIAENLARLGTNVKFLTILGDDLNGERLLDSCRQCGIDITHTKISTRHSSSVYLSILDDKGDMISAVSDMQLINELNREYLEAKHNIINNASLLVLDANLSQSVLRYITEKYGSVIDIFVDTVSTAKAGKIAPLLQDVHTLKPNFLEAAVLCGKDINSKTPAQTLGRHLLDTGLKRVYLSMGSEGVLYMDKHQNQKHIGKQVNVINTTGAGDAYMAALAFAYMRNFSTKKTLAFASAASTMAVLSRETINRELSAEKIEQLIKGEYYE